MKKFFIFFTALITLVLTSAVSANAQTITNNSLTYEFANSTTRLSASTRWNAGIYEQNLEYPDRQLGAYIADFTPKCTLTVIDQFEVEVTIRHSAGYEYNGYFEFGDYRCEYVELFDHGALEGPYDSYYYEGKYGDENHRNGSNVQPFFLFRYESEPHAPDLFRYNSITGYYVAKFFMDLPVNQDFRLGISFSTLYQQYREESGYDYNTNYISNSNIVYTNYLNIN